jgi:hypothetical protein
MIAIFEEKIFMKKLSKEEVRSLFESQSKKRYKKAGIFLYRFPKEAETILTIVSGKLETVKTSNPSTDVIIRNFKVGSFAETYIIDKEKFEKRYSIINKEYLVDGNTWRVAEAKGEVMAFRYKGEEFIFVAPWGEEMVCEYNDIIAQPFGGSPDDIYRIENLTFSQTYTEVC